MTSVIAVKRLSKETVGYADAHVFAIRPIATQRLCGCRGAPGRRKFRTKRIV